MENEKLLKELADAKVKIAELESYKRQNLIEEIKKFGNKYSDDELIAKDSEILEEILDAVKRYAKRTEAVSDNIPIVPDEKVMPTSHKIDFAHVFDDVLKEFNMTNIKMKSKK